MREHRDLHGGTPHPVPHPSYWLAEAELHFYMLAILLLYYTVQHVGVLCF